MSSRGGDGGEGDAGGSGGAFDENAVGLGIVEGLEDDFVDVGWYVVEGIRGE